MVGSRSTISFSAILFKCDSVTSMKQKSSCSGSGIRKDKRYLKSMGDGKCLIGLDEIDVKRAIAKVKFGVKRQVARIVGHPDQEMALVMGADGRQGHEAQERLRGPRAESAFLARLAFD